MKISFVKSSWGLENLSVREKCEKIADAGYDGIEEVVRPEFDRAEFKSALSDTGLKLVSINEARTLEEMETWLQRSVDAGAQLANMQTGREDMTWDEGCAFLEGALRLQDKYNLTIAHETHRKFLFNTPWQTAKYLREFPELRLCADFSHWTVVTESMLERYQEELKLACERAIHIHARIGFEQAPQVSDPRAPEFAKYVRAFEGWWDQIFDACERRNEPVLTVDPEFGAAPYLPTLPFTQAPVADQWEICLWIADHLRQRWQRKQERTLQPA